MTQNQIAYWNYLETNRHNLATEGLTKESNASQRMQAEAAQQRAATEAAYAKQYADASTLNAQSAWKNAETNAYNAQINAFNAQINARNATVNERNAATNERNAGTNEYNAETSRGNLVINADESNSRKWKNYSDAANNIVHAAKEGVGLLGNVLNAALSGVSGEMEKRVPDLLWEIVKTGG